MEAMGAPVFAGVFIPFAAPQVSGATGAADQPNNRIATSRSDPSGACNVLQLPPPLPAAADLSCRWVFAGSKKAGPVLGTGAPPCPDAWGLTCPIGRDCLATVADEAAGQTGPF